MSVFKDEKSDWSFQSYNVFCSTHPAKHCYRTADAAYEKRLEAGGKMKEAEAWAADERGCIRSISVINSLCKSLPLFSG
jgi:hypothetical protein